MPLRSTILPEPYPGKDMAENTNYIPTCEKIFWCNFSRHLSDLDKVSFAAQYLRGNVDTAWKKHLQSVDPATVTWQGYKSFLADLVTTLACARWIPYFATMPPQSDPIKRLLHLSHT